MGSVKSKIIRNPAFSSADWAALNPLLKSGQIGIELDVSDPDHPIAIGQKCGPGYWNDLGYLDETLYPYTDPVTNSIGDITPDISIFERPLSEILHGMVSPYQVPGILTITTPVEGTSKNDSTLKIGQSLSTSIIVTYTVSNPGNLYPSSNVKIEASGIFSNEVWFDHGSGIRTMTLVNTLHPATTTTYTIQITIKDSKGNSHTATAYIRFKPELIYGSSTLASLTKTQVGALPGRKTMQGYRSDFTFNNPAYNYVGIPLMNNPANLVFTDVTDPNRPTGYSMIFLKNYLDANSEAVNNGVGTYDYALYRSEKKMLYSTVLRIS